MTDRYEMPCPKCGSLEKNKTGFGSMHFSGRDDDGYMSIYTHTCGKCGCYFKKVYHYGKQRVIIKCDGKVISEKKDDIFKKLKDEMNRIHMENIKNNK
jgi:phage terminase large subunit GpA-like protein